MGLLLGGSILTLFELFDLILYNGAWKINYGAARAGQMERNQHPYVAPDSVGYLNGAASKSTLDMQDKSYSQYSTIEGKLTT